MQRRKNYLIKKSFQFSFSFKFIILLFIESVLIIGLFIYLSSDTLTTGFSNSILTVQTTQNFFLVPLVLFSLIVFVGITITALIVFTLISHKIAGPLYRFEEVLKQVNGGDLTSNFKLRNADQLEEFQNELNSVIHTLNDKIGNLKNELRELQEIVRQNNDPDFLTKVDQKMQQIQKQIDFFKVSSS